MKNFNLIFNRSKKYRLEISKQLLEVNDVLYKQGYSHKDREVILNINKDVKKNTINKKKFREIIIIINDFKKEKYNTIYDIVEFSERMSEVMIFKRKQKVEKETIGNQVKRMINDHEASSVRLAQEIRVLERKKDNAAFENNRNEYEMLNHETAKYIREKNIIDINIGRLRNFELELLTKDLTNSSLEAIKLMDENSIDIESIQTTINEGSELDFEQNDRNKTLNKLDQINNFSTDFDQRRERIVIEKSLEKSLEKNSKEQWIKEDD